MKNWPYMPGVPAAGHITARGSWHPGAGTTCHRCNPEPPKKRPTGHQHERWQIRTGANGPYCAACGEVLTDTDPLANEGR